MTAPWQVACRSDSNAGQDDEERRQATILRRAGRRKWDIYATEAIREQRKKKPTRTFSMATYFSCHDSLSKLTAEKSRCCKKLHRTLI